MAQRLGLNVFTSGTWVQSLVESESRSVVSDSLWPHGLYSPWNSPGQNTGMGSLSLLQEISPTQGSNPGLPHCKQILYQLRHKGSPRILVWVGFPFSRGFSPSRNQTGVSCIAGGFFTSWATREEERRKGRNCDPTWGRHCFSDGLPDSSNTFHSTLENQILDSLMQVILWVCVCVCVCVLFHLVIYVSNLNSLVDHKFSQAPHSVSNKNHAIHCLRGGGKKIKATASPSCLEENWRRCLKC